MLLRVASVCAATLVVVVSAGEHISAGAVQRPPGYEDPRYAPVDTTIDRRRKIISSNSPAWRSPKGRRTAAGQSTVQTSRGEAEMAANGKNGDVTAQKGSRKFDANFDGRKDGGMSGSRTGDRRAGTAVVKGDRRVKAQELEYKQRAGRNPATANVDNAKGSGEAQWGGKGSKGDARGSGEFVYDNNRKAMVNVADRDAGSGTLNVVNSKKGRANGEYEFQLDEAGRPGSAVRRAELNSANQRPGRTSGVDADCIGAERGSSYCRNNGRKSHQVRVNKNGSASLLTQRGTNFATSNGRKTGRGSYAAALNPARGRSLRQNSRTSKYFATASDMKEVDCYREVAGKRNPDPNAVQIIKDSLKVVYNATEDASGRRVIEFPSCAKVSVKAKLGRDVDANRLAYQVMARMSPVGDLTCADPGVCGNGACYYCDLCRREDLRWEAAGNTDRADLCNQKGPKTVTLTATVCPPPENFEYAQCAAIQNPYTSSFWRKNRNDESLQVHFLIWSLPKSTEGLRDNFFFKKRQQGNTFLTALRVSYINWLAKQDQFESASFNQNDIKEYELMYHYIREGVLLRKDEFKERLLSCKKGTADYNLAGSKVGGAYLVEAASLVRKKGQGGGSDGGLILDNVFKKRCAEVDKIHSEQMDQHEDDWKRRNRPKGEDPHGFLGQVFGGALAGGNSGGNTGGSSSSNPFGGLGSILSGFRG